MKPDETFWKSHPYSTFSSFSAHSSLFPFEIFGTRTVNKGQQKISKGYFCLVCQDWWNESNELRKTKNENTKQNWKKKACNSGWSQRESSLRLSSVLSSNDLNRFMQLAIHRDLESPKLLNSQKFEGIIYPTSNRKHTLFPRLRSCWCAIRKANCVGHRSHHMSGDSEQV